MIIPPLNNKAHSNNNTCVLLVIGMWRFVLHISGHVYIASFAEISHYDNCFESVNSKHLQVHGHLSTLTGHILYHFSALTAKTSDRWLY